MLNTHVAPKVSIIMPTYNRAAYILETIESIRDQTHQNWELIIIDDGSNDNTVEIVEELKDDRIHIYKAGRIGLISQVRKIGIEKATAGFIALADSDDLWGVTKLAEQVLALQQYPEAGFCLTGGYNFQVKGVPIDFFYTQTAGINYGNLFISFFKSQLSGYSQALLFRTECMDISPFKETDSDVDFITRLARNFNGVILYKPLLFRRIHDTNFSQSNWRRSYYKGINVIYSNRQYVPATIVRDALFNLYVNFGEDCILNKEPKNAMVNFLKAWTYKLLSITPLKKTGKVLLHYFKR